MRFPMGYRGARAITYHNYKISTSPHTSRGYIRAARSICGMALRIVNVTRICIFSTKYVPEISYGIVLMISQSTSTNVSASSTLS